MIAWHTIHFTRVTDTLVTTPPEQTDSSTRTSSRSSTRDSTDMKRWVVSTIRSIRDVCYQFYHSISKMCTYFNLFEMSIYRCFYLFATCLYYWQFSDIINLLVLIWNFLFLGNITLEKHVKNSCLYKQTIFYELGNYAYNGHRHKH